MRVDPQLNTRTKRNMPYEVLIAIFQAHERSHASGAKRWVPIPRSNEEWGFACAHAPEKFATAAKYSEIRPRIDSPVSSHSCRLPIIALIREVAETATGQLASPWATTTARHTLCAAGQRLGNHHSKAGAMHSWPALGQPPPQGRRSAQLASPWVSETQECRITRCSGARGWRQLRSLVRRLLWLCCKALPAKKVESIIHDATARGPASPSKPQNAFRSPKQASLPGQGLAPQDRPCPPC